MSSGNKIGAVNEGLAMFKDDISKDELASKRVDLAVVTFGTGVQVVHNFSNIDAFDPPQLIADGLTPMGEAILHALDMIEQRKQQYKTEAINYYRPWVFMLTDGAPTDMSPGDATWNEVVGRVHEGEQLNKFLFFAVGVDEADFGCLSQLAPPTRPPIKLRSDRFSEMFQWLSDSQSRVSASAVGDQIPLQAPTGWGEIPS
jgi:uncharacterized protein YegL